MTNREFLEQVVEIVNSEEVKAKAIELLEKMDNKNKKSRDKKADANSEIIKEIMKVLTHEEQTATEIAKQVEITTPKASALLRQLANKNKIMRKDVGRNKPFVFMLK